MTTILGGRMSASFKRGQQVIYIPTRVLRQYNPSGEWKLSHLLTHPGVEFGFVTGTTGNQAFCRFWDKADGFAELRTKANSELTAQANLFEYKLKPQEVIDDLLRQL